jgi:hypothetical protein
MYPITNEVDKLLMSLIFSSLAYQVVCLIVYIPQAAKQIINESLKTQDLESINQAK